MAHAEKQIIEITKAELLNKLMLIEGHTFANVVTETVVRMNKKGNPYHNQIIKRTKRNYSIGNEYEKRVNNNEKKEGMEGNFSASENRVGVHVTKCVLYNEKHDTYYLQLEPYEEIKPNSVEYFFEGNPIDKMLFQDYLVKVSESKKQQQEKKVLIISTKIDSIKSISMEGVIYQVTE